MRASASGWRERVTGITRNRILYRDGVPVAALEAGVAKAIGSEEPLSPEMMQALVRKAGIQCSVPCGKSRADPWMLQLLIETPEITLERARTIACEWHCSQTSNLRATGKLVDHSSAGRLLE